MTDSAQSDRRYRVVRESFGPRPLMWCVLRSGDPTWAMYIRESDAQTECDRMNALLAKGADPTCGRPYKAWKGYEPGTAP